MSLRDEYRARWGDEEGDRLHDAVQGKIDAGMDEAYAVDWWRMVARQRAAGEVFVAELLDDLCRRWGMDPVEVWRAPRQAQIDDEERRRWWAREVLKTQMRFDLAVTRMVNGRVIVGYDGA